MCNCNPRSLIRSQSKHEIANSVLLNSRSFKTEKEKVTHNKQLPKEEYLQEKEEKSVSFTSEKNFATTIPEKNGTSNKSTFLNKMRKWNPIIIFLVLIILIGIHGYKISQQEV